MSDQYRHLVECSPDGIVILRTDRLVKANAAAALLCSVETAERIIGTAAVELFTPQTQPAVQACLDRLRAGGSPECLDASIAADEGETVLEIAAAPLADGTIQLLLRDVTERRHAEGRLRESEERLALAVAGAREGGWDLDLETGSVVYSTRWKQMLGYDDGEIEPKLSAFERLIHPEDLARAEEAQQSVARGAATFEAEFRMRHKHGHFVHVLSRGFPVRREPGGPVVRIVCIHLYLTERKQAEAALRVS
jgi:PAS domain S-box-containing protein